ncbi:MAG TPA: hypothetical protein VEP90_01190 [Methylomirabilota bacterium]|nr:hypothetical protein [Methylomirabilota bacterium]
MTKDEMQKEIDRLRMLLGMAFMLIPRSKQQIWFDYSKDIRKVQ